jgi:hypothetical protein
MGENGASAIHTGSVTMFFSGYPTLWATGVGAVTHCSSFFFYERDPQVCNRRETVAISIVHGLSYPLLFSGLGAVTLCSFIFF